MARITFANAYTTPGGRTYKGGTTTEVNDADARSLIFRGKARPATEETSAAAGEDSSATAETNTPTGEKKGSKP